MHDLLCMLIYLGAIFSPNDYWDYEIDQHEINNQVQINQIEQDQALKDDIITIYTDEANFIDVFDSHGHNN